MWNGGIPGESCPEFSLFLLCNLRNLWILPFLCRAPVGQRAIESQAGLIYDDSWPASSPSLLGDGFVDPKNSHAVLPV